MPLLKLWNRLLGRSPSGTTAESTGTLASQATPPGPNAVQAVAPPATGEPIRDKTTAMTGRSSRTAGSAGFSKLPGDLPQPGSSKRNDTSKRNRPSKRGGSKKRTGHETPGRGVVAGSDQPGTGEAGTERQATPKRWGLPSRGGRGGDPRLRKLLPTTPISKVLEIFVGDGARTCSAFETLASVQPVDSLAYAVIDPFEAGIDPFEAGIDPFEAGTRATDAATAATDAVTAAISIKDYHRRIRGVGASVRVFPGTLAAGLQQVAWTIGSVDLVLIGAAESSWADPSVHDRIRRVCHPGTVILVQDGTSWRRCDIACTSPTRVAA